MSSTTLLFGDVIDEACTDAGLDHRALTHEHLTIIQRQLELCFIELENDGVLEELRLETRSYALSLNVGGVVLDPDVIDVTTANVLMNLDGNGAKPYPLARTIREDYMSLSFPTQAGAPALYWISKSIRTTGNTEALPVGITIPPANSNTPVLVLWPQSNLPGVTSVSCSVIRQHTNPIGLGGQLDVKRSMIPTLIACLAVRLARKWNPEALPELKELKQELMLSRSADEDHHPVTVAYRGFGWGRGRRH